MCPPRGYRLASRRCWGQIFRPLWEWAAVPEICLRFWESTWASRHVLLVSGKLAWELHLRQFHDCCDHFLFPLPRRSDCRDITATSHANFGLACLWLPWKPGTQLSPSSCIPALLSLLNMNANARATCFCPLSRPHPQRTSVSPSLTVNADSDSPGNGLISSWLFLDEIERGRERRQEFWRAYLQVTGFGCVGFEGTSSGMGVTAVSAPCGSHVSTYGQVVGPGFLCRMFLDVGTSLGCFWCSITSSTQCCHLDGKRVFLPWAPGTPVSFPPSLSFLELGPGVEGWRGRSQVQASRPGSSLNDLLEERFWSTLLLEM